MPRRHTAAVFAAVAAALIALVACGDDLAGAVNDHTRPGFASTDELLAFTDPEADLAALKFALPRFGQGDAAAVFYDPTFYSLHDEWYWFRLINGAAVPGVDVAPVHGQRFGSIDAIYQWARSMPDASLPLDLLWSGDRSRLFSYQFYNLGLGACPGVAKPKWNQCPRNLGIGTLIHLPANPVRAHPEAIWAFELEFQDEPNEVDLQHFFARLSAALPTEPRDQLAWLARSSSQQLWLASTLRKGGGPLATRVLVPEDLVVPGEVIGYNPGITAGRPKRIPKAGIGKTGLDLDDIVLLEAVPDDLPPVAGILTAVPQTPQAHLALLAQARGTPNAYLGGLLDDPVLMSWADQRQPVILEVAKNALRWRAMTDELWKEWKGKSGSGTTLVPMADLTLAPLVIDLAGGGLGQMKILMPLIGGKAAGVMALLERPDLPLPHKPVVVTVRAWAEHIAPLQPTIDALLANPEFKFESAMRYLQLEGFGAFQLAHFGDPQASAWLAQTLPRLATGDLATTVLGTIHAAGGLRAMIEAAPIEPATLSAIEAELTGHFGELAISQGLRFRSSSTAEDIEGFNGAGVYESHTGFLHADQQASEKDRARTVTHALRKVWSSYWAFDAFEERRAGGIVHVTGRMAVLVHPRFDDELEAANGVILIELAGGQALDGGDRIVMTVDVQDGDLSVTNPPGGLGALPERDRVSLDGSAGTTFAHLQGSNQVAAGTRLLSDAELWWIFERMRPLVEDWLNATNADLPNAQWSTTLTLDLEFRKMAPGWPALASGDELPGRIVFKQARPLSRRARLSAADLDDIPVPHDVLAATRGAWLRMCEGDRVHYESLELYTDPAVALQPWSLLPFDARIRLQAVDAIEALGIAKGTALTLLHSEAAAINHPQTWGEIGVDQNHWDVVVELTDGAKGGWPVRRFGLAKDGSWWLEADGTVAGVPAGTRVEGGPLIDPGGKATGCTAIAHVETPEAWLKKQLDQP